MALLIGMSGEVKGQKFELVKDRTTIGRNQNNDITLSDGAVSSQHCYLSRRADRFMIHDLNSTNGTRVNGETVVESELQAKQVLQIGACEFLFETDSGASPAVLAGTSTQVIVDKAPQITAPVSFSSVSPFGTRRKESKGVWLTIIVLVGLSALTGLVLFLYKLLK